MKFPSPYEHVLPHEIPLVSPPDVSQNNDVDRFVGSLVGLAVGDALGASVEFRPHQYFIDRPVRDMEGGGTWGLETGQWTDDTSMALCLASSLITTKGYDPYNQMVRYKWWYKHGYLSSTGQCFDIGNATRDSLEQFIYRQKSFNNQRHYSDDKLDGLLWDKIKSTGTFDVNCSTKGVAGNGALMRLAPVPLFFHKHPPIAVKYAGDSGRLTHGDKKAVDACRYYAALIVAAVSGEPKENLLSRNFYKSHQHWFGSDELHPEILRVANGSYQNSDGYEGGIRGKGYIVNALEAALWAFWSDKNSFEKGALAAVNLGDDTDTTAAIYGQLAGAFYGCNRIPEKWRKQLYAHNLLFCIGQWLYFEGQQYRPTDEEQEVISSGQSPSIISSGQSPSITSSSQHQHVQAFQPSMPFLSTDPSRTNRSSSTQLSRDQPGTRVLPVSYHGSSQIQTYGPREIQVSSRRAAIDGRLEDQSYTTQRHMRQRLGERSSIDQVNISQASAHPTSLVGDYEREIRYGNSTMQTKQYMSPYDYPSRNVSNHTNVYRSDPSIGTASINSFNYGNPRSSYNIEHIQPALDSPRITIVNHSQPKYHIINGRVHWY